MLGGEGKENGEKTTIGLISKKATLHQGPVVRRPISANPCDGTFFHFETNLRLNGNSVLDSR